MYLKKLLYTSKIWDCALSGDCNFFAFSKSRQIFILDLRSRSLVSTIKIKSLDHAFFSENDKALWVINGNSEIAAYEPPAFKKIYSYKTKRFFPSTAPPTLYHDNMLFFRSVTFRQGKGMQECVCSIFIDQKEEVFLIAEEYASICAHAVMDDFLHVLCYNYGTGELWHKKKEITNWEPQEQTRLVAKIDTGRSGMLTCTFIPRKKLFVYAEQSDASRILEVPQVIPVSGHEKVVIHMMDIETGMEKNAEEIDGGCKRIVALDRDNYLCAATKMALYFYDADTCQRIKTVPLDLIHDVKVLNSDGYSFVLAGDDLILFKIVNEITDTDPLTNRLEKALNDNGFNIIDR